MARLRHAHRARIRAWPRFVWLVVLASSFLAAARPARGELELSLTTNKRQYRPGELIVASFRAHNPEPSPLTVVFSTGPETQWRFDSGPWFPTTFLPTVTERVIPARSSYTARSWLAPWEGAGALGLGTHALTGRFRSTVSYNDLRTVEFEVVPPTFPTESFLLDFDSLPGTQVRPYVRTEFWPYGVRMDGRLATFRQGSIASVNVAEPTSNAFVEVGSMRFDMPVYGASADVLDWPAGVITMTALDERGDVLATATSQTQAGTLEFRERLTVHADRPISTLQWSHENSRPVYVDNLFLDLSVPEPAAVIAPATLALVLLLRRPRTPNQVGQTMSG